MHIVSRSLSCSHVNASHFIGDLPHFPSVLLEVLSLDQWNRFRTEGYTHFTVPGNPGKIGNVLSLVTILFVRHTQGNNLGQALL